MTFPTANLAIFRIPDEDGEKTFVEVHFVDGVLQDEASVFSLPEDAVDDSYHEMSFSHVVIAAATEDGEGSIDLARYEVTDTEGEVTEVHSAPDLADILTTIFAAYNDKNKLH